ncbi:MAG: hypothetical protein HYS27_16890 [Deltaproteobacteria bacterium]|nr:hypothetical protein [Deltaproteobacteria bacterium]
MSSLLRQLVAVLALVGLLQAGRARGAPCEPVVTVTGHGSALQLADELTETARAQWGEVRERLGLEACLPVQIDLLPSIEGAVDLDPPWHLPHWAAGAADPGTRRVVVAVTASRQRQEREQVLLHELAHLGVREAAGGRPLPRWLDEGAARVLAGEHSSEDLELLARARVADALLPLAALADGFPSDRAKAALAYAEAGRAVSLLEGDRPGTLAAVLGEVARGATLDDALARVAGRRVWQLDLDVERSIPRWRAWAVLARDLDLAFALAALVTAWAGLRARRQLRERLAAMPVDPPPRSHPALTVVRWTVAAASRATAS